MKTDKEIETEYRLSSLTWRIKQWIETIFAFFMFFIFLLLIGFCSMLTAPYDFDRNGLVISEYCKEAKHRNSDSCKHLEF